MCGIAGVIPAAHLRSDVVPALWRIHRHRGPDDHGYLALRGDSVHTGRDWDARDAGADLLLVHNRLSIIDVTETGWQPMSSADGRRHIVFNGEIYNYRELRAELEALGHTFASSSDTEVLLEACNEWGTGALTRLVGMFAFALLDLDRRTLLLARDFFGIKPLFYSHSPVGFTFGSSIHGLLETAPGPRRADPEATYGFLRFGWSDRGDQTLFEDIKHLPPAHFMEVPLASPSAARPTRYWDIRLKTPLDISLDEAAGRVREAFLRSVDLHLRSDVPVGAALSGGVDSSAVVMAMRELKGDELDLQTFSYISDDPALSEERWVDLVGSAAAAGVRKIRPTIHDIVTDMEDFIYTHGEPVASLSPYAQRYVFRGARASGVKVLLDGQGADEMLGGYPAFLGSRFASLVRRKRLVTAASFARASSRRTGVSVSNIVQQGGRLLLPAGLEPAARLLAGRRLVPEWMNETWLKRNEVSVSTNAHIAGTDLFRRHLRAGIQEDLPALLRYEDRNSMAASVESRVPFLTPELVDLVLSLPERFLVSDEGESKAVFRRAMRGIVPDPVLDRRDKIGFAASDRIWLGQARPWIDGVLSSPTARETTVLDVSRLRQRSAAMAPGSAPLGPELWRAVNLIEWSRLFDVSFGD